MISAPSPRDPFYLILQGDYWGAIAAYNVQAIERPRAPVFMNRGIAYLNLGLFEQALADFQSASDANSDLPFRSDGVLCWKGVVWWLDGNRVRAMDLWREAVDGILSGAITMTDAAGGVTAAGMLWFGASEGSKELKISTKLLRKRVKKAIWPGPVAAYLVGPLGEAELFAAAQSETTNLAARQLCQAYFYAGAKAKREGRTDSALAFFVAAASQGRSSLVECESYLARAEATGGHRQA